jgi:hydrogenase small subunit
MPTFSRREFLSLSVRLAALTGLGAAAVPDIAEALVSLTSGQVPVLWLQGQSCSGCSVSLLNSAHPDPAALLMHYISLQFHSTLSCATGQTAMSALTAGIESGGYFLAVEGSVPAGMPEACVVGEEPFPEQLVRAAKNATAVLAVGACASFGGIPAAENNPTGAVGVVDYLQQAGIDKPVIAVPGCPVHPDWLVGTLVHVLKFGMPELNEDGCPAMFFKRLIHDQCTRFADYERENFAAHFSDEGCLFKLGCVGITTRADCTTRLWNSGTSSCIKAGSPCIGCTSKTYARKSAFPFYRKNEMARKKDADA